VRESASRQSMDVTVCWTWPHQGCSKIF